MSTWLLITLTAAVLGGITFLLGEWLSNRLIGSRTRRWMLREAPRSDPLAANSDGRDED
jgi:hypothetical protein